MTRTAESNSFADRLRALRKKAGLSQEELAYLVGVHETTIRRWETSNKGFPNINDIKQLALALNVSESELLRDKPPSDWVLTIKSAHSFEEVAILAHNKVDCISQITTTKQGAALLLTGDYDIFADNSKFKAFIKQLQQARKLVLQNGQAMGWHSPKED